MPIPAQTEAEWRTRPSQTIRAIRTRRRRRQSASRRVLPVIGYGCVRMRRSALTQYDCRWMRTILRWRNTIQQRPGQCVERGWDVWVGGLMCRWVSSTGDDGDDDDDWDASDRDESD